MISAVTHIPASAWPPGWEDVEVVDSELVDEPAAAGRFRPTEQLAAGCYDGSGRIAAEGRFGRLVSVLA